MSPLAVATSLSSNTSVVRVLRRPEIIWWAKPPAAEQGDGSLFAVSESDAAGADHEDGAEGPRRRRANPRGVMRRRCIRNGEK